MPAASPTLRVDFEPIGRRITVEPGATLLQAAQAAGVALISICGGVGVCQECRVRLAGGELSALTEVEEAAFTPAELQAGMRLACQAVLLGDVKIEVPPESLTIPQRLQIEGVEERLTPEPLVTPLELQLAPPSLSDLRSDADRLRQGLAQAGIPEVELPLPVLQQAPEVLRQQDWSARLALHGRRAVALLPPGSPLLGLAVDVGTTKLAAYLVDLAAGQTLFKSGAMNPQISYGEDVISRIAYANQSEANRWTLQSCLVESLNGLLAEGLTALEAQPEQVVEAVVVGNTAMHHLFAGLPVRSLGQAPYVPAVTEPLDLPAALLGLRIAPGAGVHLPPNIAGYVGADHVAMLLATGAWQDAGAPVLALDIGTNTEISLFAGDRLLSCSCASGPAFEGAHIDAGMRAAPGAIERVQRLDGEWHWATIAGQPPVGLCGSGILDAVAEMVAASLVDRRGSLRKGLAGLRKDAAGGAFVLVPAGQSGTGRDIRVTRRDVNEIQLAKAAIRAGCEVLLAEAGLPPERLGKIVVAGAFGTYLDIPNALRLGMFPRLPLERFQQVGNAAGAGARQMLVSRRRREEAQAIFKRVEYVELTTHPGFTDQFMQAIGFD